NPSVGCDMRALFECEPLKFESRDRPFALHRQGVEFDGLAEVFHLTPSFAAQHNATAGAVAFHSGRCIDRVAEEIEEILPAAEHAGDDLAEMDADAQVPAGAEVLCR